MLANGTVYPKVTVQARRYRLRILNACNARFLNLQLYVDDGSLDSITLNPKTLIPTNVAYDPAQSTGLATNSCLQIGTEGGFLPHPVDVPLNVPFNPVTLSGSLILAPAERADVIIDFTGYAGHQLVLYNDAPAPFPVGSPLNDYFPGSPKNPTITAPGFGPNTRQIMRFDVVAATGPADPALLIPTNLTAGNDTLLAPLGVTTPPPGVPIRSLTLNETFDGFNRLIQLVGTNVPLVKPSLGFGRAYTDPATEVIQQGATEVWEIANLTGDTHPIHFHLINVQILSRQPFRVSNYKGTPTYIGPARPPDANEAGWKDTVRMNPGEVTRVIAKFTLPSAPPNVTVPSSPRAGALGVTPGAGQSVHEYVWHCHILEHEEHDMMRPLVVVG
jgi:spore coat protein A